MSKWLVALLVVISLGFMVDISCGETLLGKNYVGIRMGLVDFGTNDLSRLVGTGYGLDAVANVNVHPNIDLYVNGLFVSAAGDLAGYRGKLNALAAAVEAVYFFRPHHKVNPYVAAGLALVNTNAVVTGPGIDVRVNQTTTGFRGAGGAEIDLTLSSVFRFGIDYTNVDEDSTQLFGSFGFQFYEQMFLTAGLARDLESGGTTLHLGIIYGL